MSGYTRTKCHQANKRKRKECIEMNKKEWKKSRKQRRTYIRPRTNFNANKGRPRESADAPLSRDSEHGGSHIYLHTNAEEVLMYTLVPNTDGKLDRYTQPPCSPWSLTEAVGFLASSITWSRAVFRNYPLQRNCTQCRRGSACFRVLRFGVARSTRSRDIGEDREKHSGQT